MTVKRDAWSEGVKELLKVWEEWMWLGRIEDFVSLNLKWDRWFSPASRDEVNRLFTVA